MVGEVGVALVGRAAGLAFEEAAEFAETLTAHNAVAERIVETVVIVASGLEGAASGGS